MEWGNSHDVKFHVSQHNRKSKILSYGFNIMLYDRVKDRDRVMFVIGLWIGENIGNYNPDVLQVRFGYPLDKIRIYFAKEEDAMAFKMRWL